MTKFIPIIVFLLYLAAHVLPKVIAYLAKKQEEQKRIDAARQRSVSQFTIPTEEHSAATAPPTRPTVAAGPNANLAARRKAQLEQLRERRDQRKFSHHSTPLPQSQTGVKSTTSGPFGRKAGGIARTAPEHNRTAPGQRTVSPPVPAAPRSTPFDRGSGIARIDLEEQRRREAQQREAAERAVVMQEQRDEARIAAKRRAQKEMARMQESKSGASPAIPMQARPGTLSGVQLRSIFSDPRQVRVAFVLREILDTPPGLRG